MFRANTKVWVSIIALCTIFVYPVPESEGAKEIIKIPLIINEPCRGHRIEKDNFFRQYYDDGALFIEGTCVNGRQDGLWRQYYQDGALWIEEKFSQGLRDGTRFVYESSGDLISENHFIEGKLESQSDIQDFSENIDIYEGPLDIFPSTASTTATHRLQRKSVKEPRAEKQYEPYISQR